MAVQRFEQFVHFGDRLYWSDGPLENVGWAAVDGSACGLLAGQVGGVGISDLAVDDTYVYYAVFNELRRVPR